MTRILVDAARCTPDGGGCAGNSQPISAFPIQPRIGPATGPPRRAKGCDNSMSSSKDLWRMGTINSPGATSRRLARVLPASEYRDTCTDVRQLGSLKVRRENSSKHLLSKRHGPATTLGRAGIGQRSSSSSSLLVSSSSHRAGVLLYPFAALFQPPPTGVVAVRRFSPVLSY